MEIRVHVTQINTYLTCPRMYYFAHVLGLVPKADDPKLVFGRGVHRALAAYYSTGSLAAALEAYEAWLQEEASKAPDESVLEGPRDLGTVLVRAYAEFASKHDDFSVVSVEQPFSVPVLCPDDFSHMHVGGVPVYYEGTFDAVVRNHYGKLWLMEHKTASSFPTAQELKLNLQVSFYLLAAQQVYEDPPVGVVYNVIRKVHPARARGPVVKRELVSRSTEELKRTVGYLFRTIRRILTDEHYDPVPGYHCGWKCPYWEPCLCLQDGVDPSPLIGQYYTVDEGRCVAGGSSLRE